MLRGWIRVWHNPWFLGAALLLITLAVYWPLVHAGYIWDDAGWVYRNPVMRHWNGLWLIWFKFDATIQYYPLTFTWFFAQYRFWGSDAMGYHIVSILMQGTAGIVLWRVLRRLGLRWGWLAAVIFAIHPVQTDTVGWVAEQKNLLSGVLYFAAILFYLRFIGFENGDNKAVEPVSFHRWPYYLIAIGFFILALLAKTAVCSLPVVLLVLIWWKRNRLTWRDLILTVPLFCIGLAMGLVTIYAERHQSGAHGHAFHFTLAQRTIIAGKDIWFYLGKLVWPHPLLEIYPRWQVAQRGGWEWFYPLSVMVALGTLGLLRHRIGRGPLAAALFFCVSLFPTLGFISFYTMVYTFVADHYQYIACIGPIVLLVEGLGQGYEQLSVRLRMKTTIVGPAGTTSKIGPPMSFCVVASAAVVTLGILSHRQSEVYVPPEHVWQHVLKYDPSNWAAMDNLASYDFSIGAYSRALALYQRAEHTKGGNNYLVHQDMGDYDFQVLRNYSAAAAEYRQSLTLENHNLLVIRHLVDCYKRLGQWRRAMMDLQRGEALYPRSARLHFEIAGLLSGAGEYAPAVREYQEVVRLEPHNTMAQYDLAVTLDKLGHPKQALRHYHHAIQISPRFALAHFMYGQDLLKLQRPADAAAEFREALALGRSHIKMLILRGGKPPLAVWLNQAIVHQALGYAMAAMGNPQAARKQRQRAKQIRAMHGLSPAGTGQTP